MGHTGGAWTGATGHLDSLYLELFFPARGLADSQVAYLHPDECGHGDRADVRDSNDIQDRIGDNMQPISIGKFLLGITCMGLVWIALKPAMDEFLGPTGILNSSLSVPMTDAETVILQLSMWLCASILLIWLVIKLTKRDRD